MATRTIFALAALLLAGVVMAQAYRWVDDDGVVHFSDRPPPESHPAETITLPEFEQPSRPQTTANLRNLGESDSEESEPEPEAPFAYQSLDVANPAAEETLWNIEGVLSVSLDLQPALQPGHQVRVHFDGEPRMVAGTSFQIDEVWRGVHNIQAEILDENGKMMIRSKTNRFYVQQNTVAF